MYTVGTAKGGFFEIPASLVSGAPELCETLLQTAKGVRIERIVSMGHVSPSGFWYDQEDDEWCLVVEGEGEIAFEDGGAVRLARGQSVLIPARRRHRVTYTSSPCIWLCVFGQGLAI